MVYRVSNDFIRNRIITLLFVLFGAVSLLTLSLIFYRDVGKDTDDLFVNFIAIMFAIVLFISITTIVVARNTVLVIDKNGIVFRRHKKVDKYKWEDIQKIMVHLDGVHVIKLKIFPHGKDINVSFVHNVNIFANDIKVNYGDDSLLFYSLKGNDIY